MNRFPLLFLFVFISAQLLAQSKIHKQEINIITDNDNYDFELTDRYYSNGFIIQFNRVSKNVSATVLKKINRFELAHKVYNPVTNRRSVENVLANMDRPFAGWFYGSLGSTLFNKKNNIIEYTFNGGVMGPSAFGKEVQRGWHQFIGLYKVYGWEYQLNNSIGLNTSGAYYHTIVPAAPGRGLTMHLVSKAELGTIFSNVSAGVLLKTGWLNTDEKQSGYWMGNLGADEKTYNRKEFIFFLEPMIQYQIYNATVQGSMFTDDKGPFTTGIEPFVFQVKAGFMITGNDIGFRFYQTFRTKEGNAMMKGEHWGTIGLSFRF
ncbi:MAG: lipid A deacylase LpxR family protein [Chitinophagaceae bacterium]|nr:lipid A deacylase LpxR family protein [Chitinophagaceae bacterium]